MKPQHIIQELSKNTAIFKGLFKDIEKSAYLWKSCPTKWCLLEIICHLYDEEREDFRTRTKQVLENPELSLPPFDPVKWVKERNYIEQNYNEMLDKFINERQQSIDWLQSLKNPQWNNTHQHPKLGALSANMFLANWLAHDYLHIRQINNLKYNYLMQFSGESLVYAGNW